jgi:hypothetical protein
MKCIHNFVGNFAIAKIVVKYDTKIICFLLLQMYNHLNPRVATKLVTTQEDSIFFLGKLCQLMI